MDGMASILNQQSIEELQQSLLCITLELQSVQLSVREEKMRNEENIKQLLHLLQVAFQERDQAKDHLQRLVNMIMQSGLSQVCHVVPSVHPESPPVPPIRGKSESLSEPYNHHSYVSSSVDSLFDEVSPPPDFSSINVADSINMEVLQQPFLQEFSGSPSIGLSPALGQIDQASERINRLAMKKTLPEKGKLLQAVTDAGPLLQTLLLAGPLPQWRNPPPPQPLQIPPVPIKGPDPAALVQKPSVDPNYHVQSPPFASFHENSQGKSQTCSTSISNFSGNGYSCMKNQLVPSSPSTDLSYNSRLLNMKRRRVH
ncbi:TOX high mobility group box family member 4-A, putative isoform 1 [Cinnamomum micranthum f. kanehirae]|uniref:TOX high mobility group box family member 4-A, putative isoform 1 n=1 Tax=Cinnamomum micranthum f. kanehirae TaxID=337451 RepID=A0A3S3NAE6_9MAGN|nr:TOX high mobility group box family member 4-A, putative isoform 1 [Cinnamomum micranthum f. kanehirae]